MSPKDSKSVVQSDPAVMHGVPVFRGTRVPLQNLFDYIEAGDPLDLFLDHFPTVHKEQAIAALKEASDPYGMTSSRAAFPG